MIPLHNFFGFVYGSLMATTTTPRPKFSTACGLKIRTYDVRFKDGSRAVVRCDVRVVARMMSAEVKSCTVRAH